MQISSFVGALPKQLLEILLRTCKPENWSEVYVGCSGTFRTERALLAARPGIVVHGCDVSLFSTAVAHLALGTPLSFRFVEDLAFVEDLNLDPVARVAAIVVATSMGTHATGKPNRFKQAHFAHYRANFATYVERTAERLSKIKDELPLASYLAGDFREHMEESIRQGAGFISYPPTYCLAPEHRLLTDDLRWVASGNLKEGDGILAFDEEPLPGLRNRRWRKAIITYSQPAIKDCVRVILDNGDEIICTADHPWLADRYKNAGGNLSRQWVPADRLMTSGRPFALKALQPWSEEESWNGGWLAGFLDGEGHLKWRRDSRDQSASLALSFAQNGGPVLDHAIKTLASLGLDICKIHQVPTGNCKVDIAGGFPSVVRALGMLRPVRLLRKFADLDLSEHSAAIRVAERDKPRVLAVEPVGKREIQSISTSARTYVGEGYLMHNTGGYEKLFGFVNRCTEWETPTYRPFDPKDLPGLVDKLDQAGVPYFICADQVLEGRDPIGEVALAAKRGVYAYARTERSGFYRPGYREDRFRYTALDVATLTKRTQVAIVPSNGGRLNFLKNIYLKKSIAHVSGQGSFEIYLDGMLAGGLIYARSKFGKNTELYLMSDFSTTRSGRVAKLIARLATCREVIRHLDLNFVERHDSILTTAFSDHPAAMKYRGSWELKSRQPGPQDGAKFVLNYVSPVREETLAECFRWWWDRDGKTEVAAAQDRVSQGQPERPQAA